MTLRAAVSTLRVVSPRETGMQLAFMARVNSFCVKSPSGPIKKMIRLTGKEIFVKASFKVLRFPNSAGIKAVVSGATKLFSASSKVVMGKMVGIVFRFDCFAALVAIV